MKHLLSTFGGSSAKGHLAINVADHVFEPGSLLNGTVDVVLRRAVDAECLTVSLVATTTKQAGDSSTTVELHRRQVDLTGQMLFGAGQTRVPFSIEIPADIHAPGALDIGESMPEIFGNLLADLPSSAPRWALEADLPAAGVDLTARQPVRV